MRRPNHTRGFSLIEMLVALAVFSLVVLSLLNLAGENTRTAVVIHERVMAGVIADNRAVDAMLGDPSTLSGNAQGDETAGDLRWRWTRSLQATDNPAIVRIDITVTAEAQDHIAAELSVFRSLP